MQVRDKIKLISERMLEVHARTALRVAFVGYRDYGEEISQLDFVPLTIGQVGKRSIRDAAGMARFVDFVSGVEADGGGDTAEDVFTGLEQAALLSWLSHGTRLIIHIADAPCHGTNFHKGVVDDDYPAGDKLGRSIDSLMGRLIKDVKIQVCRGCKRLCSPSQIDE